MKDIQEMTDKFVEKISDASKIKEKEIKENPKRLSQRQLIMYQKEE